jgi:hypothetical protein
MNVSRALLRLRFIRFLCAATAMVAASVATERIAAAQNITVLSAGAPSPQASGVTFPASIVIQSSGLSTSICVTLFTGSSGGTAVITGANPRCIGNLADGQKATVTWDVNFTLDDPATNGSINFIASISWDQGSAFRPGATVTVIPAAAPAQLSLLSATPSKTTFFAGEAISIAVVVKNQAASGANSANINQVTLLESNGGGNPVCGPPSASGSGPLAPQATRTFTYTCQSNVSGTFRMAANVSGSDAVTGQALSAGPLLTDLLTVNSPAAGLQILSVAPAPASASDGEAIAVDVSVKNTAMAGGRDATSVAVAISANVPTFGSASVINCVQTSAPDSSPLAPQAQRQVSFSCVGTGNGTFTFKADATGSDAGAPISASADSPVVTVTDGVSPSVAIAPSPVPWSAMDLNFELTATDNANGSGVSSITVQIDGGSLMTTPGSSVSVSLSAEGNHTVSFFATDRAGNNSTTTAVTAGIDRSSPTISASQSPPAVAGWNNSEVTVTFACADTLSGVQTCSAPVTVSAETAGTSVSGSATDNAGNTASTTWGPVKIDVTPPTISGAAVESPNGSGWYSHSVTIHFTCTDALSGIATCPANMVISTEGVSQSRSGTAVDVAGNVSTTTAGGINIDLSAPNIDGSRSPSANVHGWNNGPVTVSFSCTDLLSGVASCAPSQTLSGEGFGQSASGTATDVAGNSKTATVMGINIDLTSPAITGAASPTANFAGWNNTPVTVHFNCSDALSGVDTCTPDVMFAMEGNFTALGAATDRAGNTTASPAMFPIRIDMTGPVVTVPASPVGAEATGPAGAAVTFAVSADDFLSGFMPGSLGCMTAGGSVQSGAMFPVGTTAVTCAALDMAGNTGMASFNVVVSDTTAPVLSSVANISVETANAGGTAVTFTAPSATDLVDGAVAATCDHASGAVYPVGVTTVVCSASDQHGNTGSTSFTITVTQTTSAPPVIGKVPGTNDQNQLIVFSNSSNGRVVHYEAPPATDSAGKPVPVVCMPASGSKFALGQTLVKCTATDSAGNEGTATFTVWVQIKALAVASNGDIFQQPINPEGSSIFHLGHVIPVEFKLAGDSAGITNLVAKIVVTKTSNTIQGTVTEKSCGGSPTSGDKFKYDSHDKEYFFNLATKYLTAGTYQVKADFGDGVEHTIRISLKK